MPNHNPLMAVFANFAVKSFSIDGQRLTWLYFSPKHGVYPVTFHDQSIAAPSILHQDVLIGLRVSAPTNAVEFHFHSAGFVASAIDLVNNQTYTTEVALDGGQISDAVEWAVKLSQTFQPEPTDSAQPDPDVDACADPTMCSEAEHVRQAEEHGARTHDSRHWAAAEENYNE